MLNFVAGVLAVMLGGAALSIMALAFGFTPAAGIVAMLIGLGVGAWVYINRK